MLHHDESSSYIAMLCNDSGEKRRKFSGRDPGRQGQKQLVAHRNFSSYKTAKAEKVDAHP